MGPGRWEVLVSWREPEGRLRQRSKTVHGTRRDAERVRDELRHRRGSDGPPASPESFGAVLKEWIDLRERVLSPSTVEVYLQMIRNRIGPALGHVDVGDLTARQLDRYYLTLSDEGLAAGTVAKAHSIIRCALEQARKWGLVERNVADDASRRTRADR